MVLAGEVVEGVTDLAVDDMEEGHEIMAELAKRTSEKSMIVVRYFIVYNLGLFDYIKFQRENTLDAEIYKITSFGLLFSDLCLI